MKQSVEMKQLVCKTSMVLFCLILLSFSHYALSSITPKLKPYNVNEDLVSVSGLSSGAYFSVQFHVAFSSSIMGVGAVAGGPYRCANNSLQIALSSCMMNPELISVDELVDMTYGIAGTFTIDLPLNMKNDKVYLFSGALDTVVVPGVVMKLEEYYSIFTSNIATEFSIPAQHSMVTNDYGNNCSVLQSPFINNCNYSTAYNILQHIYGDIKSATSTSAKEKNLMEFDQTEFFEAGGAASMDANGYIYVPSNCQEGEKKCRLHLAFHGCVQGRMFVSTSFVLNAGYNGLAEENDIIILYPQAMNSSGNPQGCWDWWGFTAPSYASQLGPQMSRVKAMLDRVQSSTEQSPLWVNAFLMIMLLIFAVLFVLW